MTFMLCGSHNNWSHFHCTFPGKHNISWNSLIPIQGSCSMCGSRCITFCDTLRIWYNSYISFRGRYGICWGFYVTFCSRCSSGQKKCVTLLIGGIFVSISDRTYIKNKNFVVFFLPNFCKILGCKFTWQANYLIKWQWCLSQLPL